MGKLTSKNLIKENFINLKNTTYFSGSIDFRFFDGTFFGDSLSDPGLSKIVSSKSDVMKSAPVLDKCRSSSKLKSLKFEASELLKGEVTNGSSSFSTSGSGGGDKIEATELLKDDVTNGSFSFSASGSGGNDKFEVVEADDIGRVAFAKSCSDLALVVLKIGENHMLKSQNQIK